MQLAVMHDCLRFDHIKKKIGKMDVSKCAQVSEFQEGGYVHIANGDYSSDVIGEIKDLENGKLLVEVDGKEQLLGLEGIWIYLKSCMFVSSLGNI